MVEKWAEWLDHQPKNEELNDEQMETFIMAAMHENDIEKNA